MRRSGRRISLPGVPAAPVQIPLWLDLSAVVVAALGGALVAARSKFDLSGIFGLALVTGLGGGLLRDLLLNQLPVAMKSPWYIIAAACAAAAVGLFGSQASQAPRSLVVLVVLDAAALGLYGISGANKALVNGLGVWPAVLIGLIAATGGGVLRDVLTAKPPSIFLRGELYATAALVGLVAYVCAYKLSGSTNLIAAAAATLTFLIRVLAWKLDLRLPGALAAADRVRGMTRSADDPDR